MRKSTFFLALLAVSVVSFLAGRYAARRESASPSSASQSLPPGNSERPRAGGSPSQPSPVRAGVGSAPAPLAPASPAAAPDSVATLESLRVLTDLAQRGIVHTPFDIVRYGKVDPRFAGLFGLTPEETGAFQRILDSAHGRNAALTQANARVTTQDENHVTIAVAPFPVDGGSLYDGTCASISALLGPERAAAFQQLSLASLENEFSGFGAAERIVTVTRKGNSDNPYSEIEDAWTQATPSGTTVATATYNLRTPDDLTRLALGSALPPAFQQLPPQPNRIAGGSHSSVMSKSR